MQAELNGHLKTNQLSVGKHVGLCRAVQTDHDDVAEVRWRSRSCAGDHQRPWARGGNPLANGWIKQTTGGEKKSAGWRKALGCTRATKYLGRGPQVVLGWVTGRPLELFPTWLPHPTEKSARKTVSWSWEKPTRACSFYA